MDRAAELQIPAETDGQVFKRSLFPIDRQKVCQCLGRMVVSAVTGVYDRDACGSRRNQRRAFLGMAHGDDVGIAANRADSICHALAFGCRTAVGGRKADNVAAQFIHGSFKAESCARGRFEEQRGELFTVAAFGIFGRIRNDIQRTVDELLQLIGGELHDVDQIVHFLPPVIQLSSDGLLRNAIRRCTSAG